MNKFRSIEPSRSRGIIQSNPYIFNIVYEFKLELDNEKIKKIESDIEANLTMQAFRNKKEEMVKQLFNELQIEFDKMLTVLNDKVNQKNSLKEKSLLEDLEAAMKKVEHPKEVSPQEKLEMLQAQIASLIQANLEKK